MGDLSVPPTQATPALRSARIRMFRQGLGDCFLLTFINSAGQKFNLLIDCGVLPFTGEDGRLSGIVQQAMAECGGSLDVLIATHEHADHISGFSAKNFTYVDSNGQTQPARIGQVWLSWTENPADPQVKTIISKVNALSMAVMGVALAVDPGQREKIQDILRFQGISLETAAMLGAGGAGQDPLGATYKLSMGLVKIMDYLRGLVNPPRYLEQKDVIDLPEFGLRFYCLGPSRDMRMLGGGAPANPDGQGLQLTRATAFLAAASRYAGQNLQAGGEESLSAADVDALFDLSLPFGRQKMLKLSQVRECCQEGVQVGDEFRQAAKFFEHAYGFGKETSDRSPGWRRIDTDWLQAGSSLALQQVSIVNNTSLVLAVELTDTGKVLLFVGDAEEENWQSWANAHAEVKDLLARTVVYKVGHHGSINATDRPMLQEMTHPELVALIPADVEAAHGKTSKTNPDGWQFPDPSLYVYDGQGNADRGALYAQTNGRIILNCLSNCQNCGPDYDQTKSWPGIIGMDEQTGLWVDYTLDFPPPPASPAPIIVPPKRRQRRPRKKVN